MPNLFDQGVVKYIIPGLQHICKTRQLNLNEHINLRCAYFHYILNRDSYRSANFLLNLSNKLGEKP